MAAVSNLVTFIESLVNYHIKDRSLKNHNFSLLYRKNMELGINKMYMNQQVCQSARSFANLLNYY